MALFLLNLSVKHMGTEDADTRIAQYSFEFSKKGEPAQLNKDPGSKKALGGWGIDNIARAFRELYSNLNWFKVFEALSQIENCEFDEELDQKSIHFLV